MMQNPGEDVAKSIASVLERIDGQALTLLTEGLDPKQCEEWAKGLLAETRADAVDIRLTEIEAEHLHHGISILARQAKAVAPAFQKLAEVTKSNPEVKNKLETLRSHLVSEIQEAFPTLDKECIKAFYERENVSKFLGNIQRALETPGELVTEGRTGSNIYTFTSEELGVLADALTFLHALPTDAGLAIHELRKRYFYAAMIIIALHSGAQTTVHEFMSTQGLTMPKRSSAEN